MGNIYAVTNDEGYNCIRIAKDTTVTELQNLSKEISNSLTEQGYSDGNVIDIIINDTSVVIDIDIYTNDYEKIGTVEYMAYEDVSTEYYELRPTETTPYNKEWSKTAWEVYSDKVFTDVFKFLSK